MQEQRGCARIFPSPRRGAWAPVVVDHRGVRLERDINGIWTWPAAVENRALDARFFFWRLSEYEQAMIGDHTMPESVIRKLLTTVIDGLFADNELAEARRMRRFG